MTRKSCKNDGLRDVETSTASIHEGATKTLSDFDRLSGEMMPTSKPSVSAADKLVRAASSRRSKPLKFVREGDQHSIEDEGGALLETFGTEESALIAQVFDDVSRASPERALKVDQPANGTLAALHAIAPRDGLEGMLAAQMVAVNNHAMRLLRKACESGVPEAIIEARENRANKFMRTFTMQMEALGKYRQRENQNPVVGQVHVHEGAQAVVGAIGPRPVSKLSEVEQ